jgi:hypothetical protein
MSQRLTAEEKQYQKRQATVGLASNVLGITAGGAALATAGKNKAFKNPSVKNAGPVTSRMARSGKLKLSAAAQKRLILAGAGGAVGLQAANLGGDLVTNRVLTREVKKNDQSMISKAEGSVRLNGHGVNLSKANNPKVAGGLGAIPVIGAPSAAIYNASQAKKGRKAAVAGRTYGSAVSYGLGGAVLGGAGLATYAAKKSIPVSAGLSGKQKLAMGALGATGAAIGASRANKNAIKRGDIKKAQRRFDPEADRQRRIGMYSAGGALGAVYLGDKARGQLAREGMKVIRPKGKKGALLGLSAIASGALGAGAYKRGVDVRNQPWT